MHKQFETYIITETSLFWHLNEIFSRQCCVVS